MIGKLQSKSIVFLLLYLSSILPLHIHIIPSIPPNHLTNDLLTQILLSLHNTQRTFTLPSIEQFRKYYEETPESHEMVKELISEGQLQIGSGGVEDEVDEEILKSVQENFEWMEKSINAEGKIWNQPRTAFITDGNKQLSNSYGLALSSLNFTSIISHSPSETPQYTWHLTETTSLFYHSTNLFYYQAPYQGCCLGVGCGAIELSSRRFISWVREYNQQYGNQEVVMVVVGGGVGYGRGEEVEELFGQVDRVVEFFQEGKGGDVWVGYSSLDKFVSEVEEEGNSNGKTQIGDQQNKESKIGSEISDQQSDQSKIDVQQNNQSKIDVQQNNQSQIDVQQNNQSQIDVQQNNETKIDDQQNNETKIDDQQKKESKIDDQQNNETKIDDQQNKESKIDDQQNNETKIDDQQNNETKIDDQQNKESKIDDQQNNETKIDDQQNKESKIDDQQNNQSIIGSQQKNESEIIQQEINKTNNENKIEELNQIYY